MFLMIYIFVYYNIDNILKTLYFSNFQVCHHNEVISDNENLYYNIKHINIFILYVYLIFILKHFIIYNSISKNSLALALVYIKYNLNIFLNDNIRLCDYEISRHIMWLFATPLMLKMYCKTNNLTLLDINVQYHILPILINIFIYPYKNTPVYYFFSFIAYMLFFMFMKTLYEKRELLFTNILILVWTIYVGINTAELLSITDRYNIQIYYLCADMIGKLTTNIIIHDYNERLLFIKNNMNLQSVNFVSNMLENIKKYNTNNPNMTDYCNNYIKHIKSNFMSVIPENNDSLRKELLKKILPLGFDDNYMQSSTNIIKKISSFSSTDSNTVSNTDSKQYNMVCILFTDIVNYTDLAKKYDDKIIFQLLNTVYNRFDNVIKKYTHLQKVETIGDAYMVVGDIYRSTENYKSVIKEIILLSFDLVKEIKNINTPDNNPLSIRVGINMGRVSVGILGNEIPRLCVVGNAVNVASRLQSTAEADSIQISRHIYEQLEDIEFDMIFDIKTNENVFLKNIGSLTTYTISNASNTNVLKEN